MFFMTKARHEREIAQYVCDLDEAEQDVSHYRHSWLESDKKNKELQKQLDDQNMIHREKEAAALRIAAESNKFMNAAIEAKSENAILRQIVEDLSGKPADKLIAAHKRAVRMLEYGVREELNGRKENQD